MFQSLTQSLTNIFYKMKGTGTINANQIHSVMRDIRIALLEADVALPVIRTFISRVTDKALGQKVIQSVSPAQMIIKIINDEIVNCLSSSNDEEKLNLNVTPPANIFIIGLQGNGKTTASAKLALRLKNKNKKILLVSLDTYRPAAQNQLKILAQDIKVDYFSVTRGQKPLEITSAAINQSKLFGYDVVIYDSAGRLHIDTNMIQEAIDIKKILQPVETLLVIDSMMGQEAISVANTFEEKVSISGIILSKIDGDARGGAALSVRHVTKKPIKFLSIGEKTVDFEEFDAKRISSRILGMGDVVSFVEQATNIVNEQEAHSAAIRLKQGKFDLNDYINQIKNIRKLGGVNKIMVMMPGLKKFLNKHTNTTDDTKILNIQEAIVLSMTKKERYNPNVLNASRKKRIASGSGTTVQQVNMLLKQYRQISTLIKQTSKINTHSLIRSKIKDYLS